MENAINVAAEVCRNCIWFRRLPLDPKNIGRQMQGGICKRMPPTPILLPSPDGNLSLQAMSPPVSVEDTCGEFDDGVEVEESDEAN